VHSYSYDSENKTYSSLPPVVMKRSEFLREFCGFDVDPVVEIKAFGQLSPSSNSCIIFDT
jgi:hypothetical protein